MRDLRKQALESGKTTSRKAQSRAAFQLAASPAASTAHSRASSALPSREVSRAPSQCVSEASDPDDPIENVTDKLAHYEPFFEENGSESGAMDVTSDASQRLSSCIEALINRKKSSTSGRTLNYSAYVHHLQQRFCLDDTSGHADELVPAMMRSIRGGQSDQEILAALRALTATTLTVQSVDIFDQCFNLLKTTCERSDEELTKVEAIYVMAVVTQFGGGMQEGMEALMDFLLDIIESDGHVVEAPDNGAVVTIAIQAWAFLASQLDDLEVHAGRALDAFAEQLDSTDAEVQMAVGAAVALVFEKVRTHTKKMQEEHEANQETLRIAAGKNKRAFEPEPFNPFDLQHVQHTLEQRIGDIVSDHSRAVSKKDRRELRKIFGRVLASLEQGVGPGGRKGERGNEDGKSVEVLYSEAINIPSGRGYGTIFIDSWELSVRVAFLRKTLGAGFVVHLVENPAVQEQIS